jgi:DNA-binding NarL/FixJ family response regulator
MGRRSNQHRLGNISAVLRAAATASDNPNDTVRQQRAMVAEFCRILGQRVSRQNNDVTHVAPDRIAPQLSPRMQQTLQLLLAGESEKQIAGQLRLSPHTVHVYVKALHREFGVSSRGELLARFIGTNGLSISSSSR